ncbi:hypothetical protein MRX96_007154 [Rhipicephalus microplus]
MWAPQSGPRDARGPPPFLPPAAFWLSFGYSAYCTVNGLELGTLPKQPPVQAVGWERSLFRPAFRRSHSPLSPLLCLRASVSGGVRAAPSSFGSVAGFFAARGLDAALSQEPAVCVWRRAQLLSRPQ